MLALKFHSSYFKVFTNTSLRGDFLVVNTNTILLASSSITRQRILSEAGIKFQIIHPNVDETEIKSALIQEKFNSGSIAEVLAENKARQISLKNPSAYVISSDQVLDLGGKIISKPPDIHAARDQLLDLRGKKHRLFSFVCVFVDGIRLWHVLDTASMWMRDFSEEFLKRYLEALGDTALNFPGAYCIENRGIQLFSKISGNYFTILGLPLLPLLKCLREQGVIKL